MKQEQKNLLFKDLSARFPYGVKCEVYGRIGILDEISSYGIAVNYDNGEDTTCRIECVKPYLFPLSSMTEEQKEEYCELQQKVIYNSKGVVTEDVMNYVNWCYENHLDINDLIPKDLAIDATNKNIY